jgi:uncharacterized repeat protein (TIGR03943 family)
MSTEHEPCCGHEHETAPGRSGVWLQTGTLLLLAAFLLFSFLAGRVRLFVAPAYVWLPPLAAVVLLAMGAARLIAHRRGGPSCACDDRGSRTVSQAACALILLVPVGLALAVSPKGFTAEGIRKRMVSRPARDAPLEQAVNWVLGFKTAQKQTASGPVSLPQDPTILDLLNAVGQAGTEALEGRYVTVIGQCDLPSGPESPRLALYRLVVTCCIADATAVSVEVARKPTVKLQSGQWVRAGGILKFDSPIDPSLPVVHATTVAPIAEPREPYL